MNTRHRRLDTGDSGVVGVIVAIMVPLLLILVGIAVDTGRWYVEGQRLQNAADAAALAGVPALNGDAGFDRAATLAVNAAARNGYAADADTRVVPFSREANTEMGVSVTSTVNNVFGSIFGRPTTTLTRTAVADFESETLLGSPCNALGNQPPSPNLPPSLAIPEAPPSGNGYPTCQTPPELWALIEGFSENKANGDRYATGTCAIQVTGRPIDCNKNDDGTFSGPPGNNEHRPTGYFYVVRVEDQAVGEPISVQVYDPAYKGVGQRCENMPQYSATVPAGNNRVFNNMNPYVGSDVADRYGRVVDTDPNPDVVYANRSLYCPGDSLGSTPPNTSFALFRPTVTRDPLRAEIKTDTSGQPCTVQFRGTADTGGGSTSRDALAAALRQGTGTYNRALAEVFHQWVVLCTFTADEPGDYYIQVRTNHALPASGGEANTNSNAPIVYRGNPALEDPAGLATETGTNGANAYSMRAVVGDIAKARYVSVSGFRQMALFANRVGSESEFNLLPVFTNSAGKSFDFEVFDGGDCTVLTGGGCSETGTVRIIYPLDATFDGSPIPVDTSPATCRSIGPAGVGVPGTVTEDLVNCTATFSNATNNGRLEKMSVSLPSNYRCAYSNLGSCWFRVEYKFAGANTALNDVTTWYARVVGDSLRLID